MRLHSVVVGALVVCVLLGATASVADAANNPEARCTALGANCVCAETLNTNSYTAVSWNNTSLACGSDGAGCFWNPNNSTVKQCTHEFANSPVSTYSEYHGSNNATALAALPSGHSVSFFGARIDLPGIWWLGADITNEALGATFNARMSVRFYVYHGPNYNFRDDSPAQCHSKFIEGNPVWLIENFVGPLHMYAFSGSNWGPPSAFPRDCCSGNAPGAEIEMSKAIWRGRWWFVEAVSINRSGPGWRTIVYMRDVTRGVAQINNGVEFVGADTFGTTSGVDPWTTDFNTVITSNPRQLPMKISGYREISLTNWNTGAPLPSGGIVGRCDGIRGYSHMMYAGWDTNAGQRIGAATEVEGGIAPANTDRGTLAGATAVSGSTPGRVMGTNLTPRPAIRNALLGLAGAVVVALLIVAHHALTRRMR